VKSKKEMRLIHSIKNKVEFEILPNANKDERRRNARCLELSTDKAKSITQELIDQYTRKLMDNLENDKYNVNKGI